VVSLLLFAGFRSERPNPGGDDEDRDYDLDQLDELDRSRRTET